MGQASWAEYVILILQFITIAILVSSAFQTAAIEEGAESYSRIAGTAAVIPINGEITADRYDGDFISGPLSVSDEIVFMLEKADEDPSIKSIVLAINSLGGSPVAADEIAQAIKAANKTTVAWIRESGTSGAYRIASAADWIIANKKSDVGSIGVITQYEIYNVTYETVKSGRYKDLYTDNRLLTDEERKIAQDQIDTIHRILIQDIAENRGMNPASVEELATGLSWPGITAKELGLVDELGGKAEVLKYIEDQTGEKPVLAYYNRETQAFDLQTEDGMDTDSNGQ